MSNFSKHFYKKSQIVKLSDKQKSLMHQRLLDHMETYQPVENGNIFAYCEAILFEFKKHVALNFSKGFRFVALAAVLFFVGIGVTITAERSVPGDTLYALKVGFNEGLVSKITTDPYEKVKWETSRLNRRLSEVRLLAEKGELTKDIETEVTKLVKDQAEVVDKKIYELKNSDVNQATIAAVELEALLSMQANALQLSVVQSGEESQEGVQQLSKVLHEYINRSKLDDNSLDNLNFKKLMAAVEKNTTRIYELIESHKDGLLDENLQYINSQVGDLEEKIKMVMENNKDGKHSKEDLLNLLSILKQSQELIVYGSEFSNLDIKNLLDSKPTEQDKTKQILKLKTEVDKKMSQLNELLENEAVKNIKDDASSTINKVYKLQNQIATENNWDEFVVLYNDFYTLINSLFVLLGADNDSSADNNILFPFNKEGSTTISTVTTEDSDLTVDSAFTTAESDIVVATTTNVNNTTSSSTSGVSTSSEDITDNGNSSVDKEDEINKENTSSNEGDFSEFDNGVESGQVSAQDKKTEIPTKSSSDDYHEIEVGVNATNSTTSVILN